jgi:hypothetical protein
MAVDRCYSRYVMVGLNELNSGATKLISADKLTTCKYRIELTTDRSKEISTFTKPGVRTWGLASVDNNINYSN